ncbi:magnetosome protein Mad4 [Fundidesulfovibrio magnetotacticus]|uniref:Magnetosome protein Mad4 n=1 Tax=Fundidesulfovibrio magnetotacticus TaxID=2730080 RepID=A0A6V8LKT6_9BACT|nr:hypothetical protein [Fundidesulfovibrio magnetotacticus]GFK92294.1 magnetosome protein Mad4 [Fundidesulfovibrio magnetotacticus]
MGILKEIESTVKNLEAYLGVKTSTLAAFGGSVALVALVSTAAYWGVYGFGHWKNEMSVANKIMLAATAQPLAGQPVPGRPAPQAGQTALQAAPSQAGQYVCNTHGVVGLPRVGANGQPVCPICGQTMQFRCLPTAGAQQPSPPAAATVAAWAG